MTVAIAGAISHFKRCGSAAMTACPSGFNRKAEQRGETVMVPFQSSTHCVSGQQERVCVSDTLPPPRKAVLIWTHQAPVSAWSENLRSLQRLRSVASLSWATVAIILRSQKTRDAAQAAGSAHAHRFWSTYVRLPSARPCYAALSDPTAGSTACASCVAGLSLRNVANADQITK